MLSGYGVVLHFDITLTSKNRATAIFIPVPTADPVFDPFGEGNKTLPFSPAVEDENGTRTNSLTAYVDMSGLYGSDNQRATDMRLLSDGLLKSQFLETGEYPMKTDSNGRLFFYGIRLVNRFPVYPKIN